MLPFHFLIDRDTALLVSSIQFKAKLLGFFFQSIDFPVVWREHFLLRKFITTIWICLHLFTRSWRYFSSKSFLLWFWTWEKHWFWFVLDFRWEAKSRLTLVFDFWFRCLKSKSCCISWWNIKFARYWSCLIPDSDTLWRLYSRKRSWFANSPWRNFSFFTLDLFLGFHSVIL